MRGPFKNFLTNSQPIGLDRFTDQARASGHNLAARDMIDSRRYSGESQSRDNWLVAAKRS
jgi:hypothetical protein